MNACLTTKVQPEEVVRCFNNSTEDNKLRYKTYIGKGDTQSIAKADPYPGMVVEEGECIGHIQKLLEKVLD